MKRLIVILLIPLITAFSCGPNLRSNDIESVVLNDPAGNRMLATNADIDRMALDIAAFLKENGFEVLHTSRSYGVKPWTGHTQTIHLSLSSNEYVQALIIISECCIETTFKELETAVGSGIYAATPEQQEKIKQLRPLVESFIQSRLEGSDRPNKGFNRTPESSAAAKPGELSGGAG